MKIRHSPVQTHLGIGKYCLITPKQHSNFATRSSVIAVIYNFKKYNRKSVLMDQLKLSPLFLNVERHMTESVISNAVQFKIAN